MMVEVAEMERCYWSVLYRDRLGDPEWKARVHRRLAMLEGDPNDLCFMRRIGLTEKPNRILSAGCGTGNFILSWLRYGTSDSVVYGIDLSDEVLAIARKKAASTGIGDRARLYQGNIERLPWEDGLFDVVHCQDVLEHVSNTEMAISELLRVTRPGCYVFIHVPDYRLCFEPHYRVRIRPSCKAQAMRVLRDLDRPLEYLEHLNFVDPSRIEQMARRLSPRSRIMRLGRRTGNPFLWMYHRLAGLNYDILVKCDPRKDETR
jgi:2-polyprenyl-3-methyl-5-hydroxy-6-metoxy-1,4-benzoquinol methylase